MNKRSTLDVRTPAANDVSTGGGWVAAHEAALAGLAGAALKVRPDGQPVVAQVNARDRAAALALDGQAQGRAGLAVVVPSGKLREVHPAHADLLGESRDASGRELV